jgi:hydroxyacylglutathione hydrolase
MSRMKRVLKILGAILVVLALAAGWVWYTAFSHNSPIVDEQKLAPGVETVKDGFVSAVMLDTGPGKVALVDAGKDDQARAILAALSRRGLSKSAVTAIFLTHGHPDHTAGCKVFPDAQVYALEAELPTVGDAAKIARPLHDGDAVDVGDLHVVAFATPGHTPGSVVYLARGVLFFGDSAGASKDGAVMPAVRLFSKDPDQNLASLKALELRLAPHAADVKVLAFAHTGPLQGFAPLAAFAANH